MANSGLRLHRQLAILCKEWPINKKRISRDLGAAIHKNIEGFLRHGGSESDQSKWEDNYKNLQLINTDHSRKKWPTTYRNSFTGGSPQIWDDALADEEKKPEGKWISSK